MNLDVNDDEMHLNVHLTMDNLCATDKSINYEDSKMSQKEWNDGCKKLATFDDVSYNDVGGYRHIGPYGDFWVW